MLIVNFFTGVLPENYVFTWHKANIRSINWLEDDLGFVSTAADNTIAVWMLPRIYANAPPNVPFWTFKQNNANFLSTVSFKHVPEKDKEVQPAKITVFASCSDNSI